MSQRKLKTKGYIEAKNSVRQTGQEGFSFLLPVSVALLVCVGIFLWPIYRRWRKRNRKTLSESGYVLIRDKLEHRLIAERVLGRKLVEGEVVHHINGVKTDNDVANLCVLNYVAHEEFHRWVNLKYEREGRYPTKKYQRAVLRYRYQGTLLIIFPDDFSSEPKHSGTE